MNAPNNKTILLIDDDSIANMISMKVIEMNSTFNVIGFTNACDALESLKKWSILLEEQFPSFIFLDVNMPVMDGWEFLQEFQKLPQSVVERCKVFMLSSSIDPRDMQKSKMYKCVQEFVSKPLTPEKLEILNAEVFIKDQKW